MKQEKHTLKKEHSKNQGELCKIKTPRTETKLSIEELVDKVDEISQKVEKKESSKK